MYKLNDISTDKAYKLIKQPNWQHIYEQQSTRGESNCYWNEKTDELIWIDAEENNTYNKKV